MGEGRYREHGSPGEQIWREDGLEGEKELIVVRLVFFLFVLLRGREMRRETEMMESLLGGSTRKRK